MFDCVALALGPWIITIKTIIKLKFTHWLRTVKSTDL